MALLSRVANYLKTTTGLVNVYSASAPSVDQVLTATSATAATWQTPAGGGIPTAITLATDFADTARHAQNVSGGGVVTFSTYGMQVDTSATGTSHARCAWSITGTNGQIELGSPTSSYRARLQTLGTDVQISMSLGFVGDSGTAFTFTNNHIGWKITRTASGTTSLFASQGNGTTETASAALITVALSDELDLISEVNTTASVDYYYRQNAGALSSATNLATNLPASAIGGHYMSINNLATATQSVMRIYGAGYQR